MKKTAIFILLIMTVLCGCKAESPEPNNIKIADFFTAAVSITCGEYKIDADMTRTMPGIYDFAIIGGELDGGKISVEGDILCLELGDLSFETDKISKASFIYGFTLVLDYLSSPEPKKLITEEIRQDMLSVTGNDGYEDFEAVYDLKTGRVNRITVPKIALEAIFTY